MEIQHTSPHQYSQTSPPCDVGLHNFEHVGRGLVELNEDSVVDLPQSQQLKDLAYRRTHTVDAVRERVREQVTCVGVY